MMSLEGFAKMLQPRIDAGTPFLAYWHSAGMMVLNTGTINLGNLYKLRVTNRRDGEVVETDWVNDKDYETFVRNATFYGEDLEILKKKTRTKKVSKGTVNKLRKIIAQLQKDPRIGPVYTVEFDGTMLIKEGDDLDALSALRVPAGRD